MAHKKRKNPFGTLFHGRVVVVKKINVKLKKLKNYEHHTL
jgi:hypothetical protein